jgi:hypothetical protein
MRAVQKAVGPQLGLMIGSLASWYSGEAVEQDGEDIFGSSGKNLTRFISILRIMEQVCREISLI